MNRNIMIGAVVFIVVLLSGSYFIFSGQSSDRGNQESTGILSGSKIFSKDVSELVLDISDLPEGYKIKDSAPRVKSDVSEQGITFGWEEGYYIQFVKGGNTILDGTYIEQHISRYPLENITRVISLMESNENVTYESIPISKIGGESNAYKVTEHNEILGEGFDKSYYQIEFIEKDIYISIRIDGIEQDFELLKKLAKEVSSKI